MDRLFGGNDDDIGWGGTGTDGLFGGFGNDTLYGEDGNDRFFGETGDDLLFGGTGSDTMYGGRGLTRLMAVRMTICCLATSTRMFLSFRMGMATTRSPILLQQTCSRRLI
ncbi:calcium-binding protein [Sulfitobacter aestuariivivens]|uniref:calcium-binding protein n=1 Tax=Sulfitobacter aestuariivivens TaxID=2766981 RepID=UPI003611E3FF